MKLLNKSYLKTQLGNNINIPTAPFKVINIDKTKSEAE